MDTAVAMAATVGSEYSALAVPTRCVEFGPDPGVTIIGMPVLEADIARVMEGGKRALLVFQAWLKSPVAVALRLSSCCAVLEVVVVLR